MRDARREVPIQQAYPEATSVSLAVHLVASITSPSGRAIRNEMNQVVEQAIAALGAMDQEILALRHYEELSNVETAGVLGIEEKAASIRYVRALARLKKVLADIPGFMDA